MTRVELKEKAKASLKGKLGKAILVGIALFLISGACGFVLGFISGMLNLSKDINSLLQDILSFVISGMFTFGYMSFFLKMSRDEEVEVDELWSKTNMFVTFIIASLLVGLFTTLWTLLFIIPGIIAAYSYQMTFYILLDNPDMNVMDAIKKSKEMMKGHKMDLFILQLSFIGWAFVGIFTLVILYLWLIPYMNITMCNFYNDLKERELA